MVHTRDKNTSSYNSLELHSNAIFPLQKFIRCSALLNYMKNSTSLISQFAVRRGGKGSVLAIKTRFFYAKINKYLCISTIVVTFSANERLLCICSIQSLKYPILHHTELWCFSY